MTLHPDLYVRGHLRIVASAEGAPVRVYLVVDSAGALLFEAASFEAARDWVDARIAERDAATPPASAPVLSR